MILTAKDDKGLVYSYITFNVVDEESRLCSDGKYVFINGFWIHKDYRVFFRKILNLYILEIFKHKETQKMEWVYWERDNGKIVKYLASRFIKKLGLI